MTKSEKIVIVMEQRDSIMQITQSYLATLIISFLLYNYWCK